MLESMMHKAVMENAATAQDQEEYSRRYNDLISRFESLQARQASLQKERVERERKADALDAFLFELTGMDDLDMEFSPRRWNAIVDRVTVHSDGRLVFSFHNGSEVTVMV